MFAAHALSSFLAHGFYTYSMTLGFNLPPHTPLAEMSSLSLSYRLAEAPLSWSGITGCRSGSTQTLLHTLASSNMVMSRISLCLIKKNPPLARDSAYSTPKCFLQTQVKGMFIGVQPYLSAMALWKTALYMKCEAVLCQGKTVNQGETPVCLAISMASWSCSG